MGDLRDTANKRLIQVRALAWNPPPAAGVRVGCANRSLAAHSAPSLSAPAQEVRDTTV